MMVYTKVHRGKRSVVVVNASPLESDFIINAVLAAGNSKYYVMEDNNQ